MDAPEVLLQAIYANAEMGHEALGHLAEKADESAFAAVLKKQQSGYDTIRAQAGEMLAQMGERPRGVSPWLHWSSEMGMDMKTARDKSTAKMAQMLIQGAAMGISDLREEIEKQPDIHPKVRALGEALIDLEQKQIDQYQHLL